MVAVFRQIWMGQAFRRDLRPAESLVLICVTKISIRRSISPLIASGVVCIDLYRNYSRLAFEHLLEVLFLNKRFESEAATCHV